MSVVTANLVLVLFIEDGISEGENIPARVAWWSNINDRIRDGMLDNVNVEVRLAYRSPPRSDPWAQFIAPLQTRAETNACSYIEVYVYTFGLSIF